MQQLQTLLLSCLSIKQQEIMTYAVLLFLVLYCWLFYFITKVFLVALNGTRVNLFLIGKILKQLICCVKPVSGCPNRFHRKFQGHNEKIPGQNNKTKSSLNVPGQHMSSQ